MEEVHPGASPSSAQEPITNAEPSAAEMRAQIQEMVAVCRQIDAEWATGHRDMMRANTWALAGDVKKLFEAILAEDAGAFYAAAQQTREHAFRATIHGRNWRNGVPVASKAEA